ESLLGDGPAAAILLRERAGLLEQQAIQLRKLAQRVHVQRTLAELARAVEGADKDIDLLQAALLIAKLDNEELDVGSFQAEVDRLASQAGVSFQKKADEPARLKALNQYLFKERGFHGSRVDYYTRANSYINEVIEDREGIPITLSVLYMELARRLKINVVG